MARTKIRPPKPPKKSTIKLLPAQKSFLDKQCPFPCFVGGYGSGKSQTLIAAALRDARANPKSAVGIFAPTYDLLELILIQRIREIFEEKNIEYRYNKQKFFIESPGMARLIFRSLTNPARIVGFEVVSSHIDELDTLPEKKAADAWRKVLGRTRAKNTKGINQTCVYTTPEGLGFVYKKWGRNPKKGYELVRAKTLSNPFLRPDYLDNLLNDYPEQLVNAYVNGEFCNLSQGTVYYAYDRKENRTGRTVTDGDRLLHVGMDFNITNMSAVAFVEEGGLLLAVDEIVGAYDTRDMIGLMRKRWGKRQIIVYPDPAAKNRSTNASETDVQLLKKEFQVKVANRHPEVKDRVNVMNGQLCNAQGDRRLLVNDTACPTFAEALESQVYDERTGAPDKKAGFDHILDASGYCVYAMRADKRRSVAPSGIRLY